MSKLRTLLLSLIVSVSAFAAPSKAQLETRHWVLLLTDTTARQKFHESLVRYYDSANVQRAGPKVQIWELYKDSTFYKNGPAEKQDSSQVMFNCATYQFRIIPDPQKTYERALIRAKAGLPQDNRPAEWDDIPMSPESNPILREAKVFCPAQ